MAASTLAPALMLLYHGLERAAQPSDARFTLSRAAFYDHLWLLRRWQQRGEITVVSLPSWWQGKACQGRPVVLCFDDGRSSDVEIALPALLKFGMPASFFLNTAHIGAPGYLTWNGVAALQRAGMDIESHGHEHRPLTQFSAATLAEQLRTSRHMLQDHAGTPVHFLAAPYGLWNRQVFRAALQVGFSALCTSHPGLASPLAPRLARNGILARTSARQLQRWLAGRLASFAWPISRDYLLWTPKYILMHCPSLRQHVAPLPAGDHSASTF